MAPKKGRGQSTTFSFTSPGTLPVATEDCQVEVADTRPDTSPYGSLIPIQFGSGPSLKVPNAFIQQYPKLVSRLRPLGNIHFQYDTPYNVKDIPYGTGHVLIHYLYTGTYQSLKPAGSSSHDKRVAEFKTSMQVHALARECEMRALEELAREEIKRLGRDLPVAQLFDLMTTERYTADDIWFRDYIKSVIEPLLENPSSSPMNDLPESSRQKVSLPIFLLAAVVDLWREKKGALRPVATQAPEPGAARPSEESEEQPACDPESGFEDSFGFTTKTKKEKKKAKALKKMKGKKQYGFDWAGVPVPPEATAAPVEEAPVEEIPADEVPVEAAPAEDEARAHKLKEASAWSFWGASRQPNQHPFSSSFSFTNDNSAPPFSPSSFDTPSSSGRSGTAKESNTASGLDDEMDRVPTSLGFRTWAAVTEYQDVHDPSPFYSGRFLHICAQDAFKDFSPEELRWKDLSLLKKLQDVKSVESTKLPDFRAYPFLGSR
ncbi:hypothetical protein Hte_002857 [Hypoxylon texense]